MGLLALYSICSVGCCTYIINQYQTEMDAVHNLKDQLVLRRVLQLEAGRQLVDKWGPVVFTVDLADVAVGALQ